MRSYLHNRRADQLLRALIQLGALGLIGLGIIAIYLAVRTSIWFHSVGGVSNRAIVGVGLKLFIGVVFCIFTKLTVACYRYGKRFGLKPAELVLQQDRRRPVLYLRPFELEELSTKTTTIRFEGLQTQQFIPSFTVQSASYEEHLSSVLTSIGPCITVSQPGFEAVIPGFARLRLQEHNWQHVVETLLREAALVLVCSGTSPGIQWEFGKAVELVPRSRLAILVTPHATKEWWTFAEQAFNCRLPRISSESAIAISGVIYFDDQGKPQFDTVLHSDSKRIKRELRNAFQPLFERLGPLKVNTDFQDLLSALNAHKVEYLITGAHALAAQGQAIATKDLTLWVRPDQSNSHKVLGALSDFGAPIGKLTVDDFSRKETVFQIPRLPFSIDIVTNTDGVEFAQAWPDRLQILFGDVPAFVISRHHLIANKKTETKKL